MNSNAHSTNPLAVKRIVIFCAVAFIPLWIAILIMKLAWGKALFESEKMAGTAYVFGAFYVFLPALANILTRVITKEGFKNSYLGLNVKGKVKYFIASIAVALIAALICTILLWRVFSNGLGFSDTFPSNEINMKMGTLLLQLALSVIMLFPAFGEEWGWRGYLMPKLTEIIAKPLAVILGGTIWGLWYAPLIISGYNFGTKYDFYPFGGILTTCAICILMNAFLTFLTERTKSIFPASFCHMIMKNITAVFILSVFGSEALNSQVNENSPILLSLVCLPVFAVIGIISFIFLLREKNK